MLSRTAHSQIHRNYKGKVRGELLKFFSTLCGVLLGTSVASPLAYAAPEIIAKQQRSFVDANGDNQINPGEEVEYVITVTNPSGENIENLTLASSIDPNVIVSSAAKVVSTGAFDDCYGTSLNSSITKSANEGLLSNDLAGFTIVPGSTSSARGVSVSINADGSFTYTPPADFSGTDTFSYSAIGSDGESNVGKVSITVLSSLSGSQVTDLQSILGVTGTSTIVSTLRADLNSIGASLTGATSTATTAALKSAVAGVQNTIDGSTTGSVSSKLLTASNLVVASGSRTNLVADMTSAISNLGGSGTLGARITALASKLLIAPSGNISTDIGTLQALLTGTPAASLQGDIRNVNTAINGVATGSTTLARVSTLTDAIDSGATNISAAVTGVTSALGNSGDLADRVANLIALIKTSAPSLNSAVTDVATLLGSTGTLADRVNSLLDNVLITPTGTLSTDLSTLRGLLVTTPASTAQSDIQTIATKLNGTASGGTIEGRIGSATLNTVASNISAVLGNTGTSLAQQLGDPGADYTNISSYLDSSGSSNSIVTQIQNVLTKLVGTTVSAQSLLTLIGNPKRPVPSGHPSFPLQDTNIGSLLGTGYPLATSIGTPPSYLAPSISAMLGGSSSTLVGRIQGLLNIILVTPSEVVRNDLATFANLMVDTPGSSLEGNLRDLNSLLNGDPTTGTMQSRIGSPTANSSLSSLSAIIGGSSSTLAEKLGDPVGGTTGLSGLIKAGSASCSTLDCSNFNNSTDLNGQITAFINTMNNGGTLPSGSYTSLADILAAMQ